VRRQLASPESSDRAAIQLPLRILYMVSRPADTGFIDPRLTTRSLFDALDPLGASVRIDFCRPPTLGRMDEMLREQQRKGEPYHLVHFDRHGAFLPEAQIGALCFEKPDQGADETETDFVRADRLGTLLAGYRIPLVVLEACRSPALGKTAVFRSVAPRLIQAGVGSVVSMSHAVHVEAARVLLDRFYRELVRGTSIGHAVAQGRSALVSADARWIEPGPQGRTITLRDWFLPQLYQRGTDQPLLPADTLAQQPVRRFDLFLSHNKNDKSRVEALARSLSDRHGLRVWLDAWEMLPGTIEQQCEQGIRQSRFILVAASQAAVQSKWVEWEIQTAIHHDPQRSHIIPLRLEPLELPGHIEDLLWVDLLDAAENESGLARLASLVRSLDARDARALRGFRPPPEFGQPGGLPRPPQYGFQGRAQELHELERRFRHGRGLVLHAMGGMGKTALAAEAARWWTRSGLFPDGACFVSFEQFTSAERVVQLLGEYAEGPRFHQRPGSEQRRRAIELLQRHRLLLVWDNYESALPQFGQDPSADQASPYTDEERRRLADLFHNLTQTPGQGCLLVTCRPGEPGLPGAQRLELQGLARPDSLWLLHRILGRDGASLDDPRLARERLDPLLRDLAGHPLSLELVGPHLHRLTPEQIRADFGELLKGFQQQADEDRNRSLLASLEFSRRHLSEDARAALPWVGLFSGGVFEVNLLDVCQIEPAAWKPIRAELQGIALLRSEDGIPINNRPFLRFHPTLAIASADHRLAQDPGVRGRFIAVYVAVARMLEKMLSGAQSRAALAILEREETNYRTAVRWALADGQQLSAARLGDTFRTYLERSGRLRERDSWVQWLRDAVTHGDFTEEAAVYERQNAWTFFTQGQPQEAVQRLKALVERLSRTTEFDPAFQLAMAIRSLGQVLVHAGASSQAIPISQEAVGHWEALVERAGGRPWEGLLATPDHAKAATELGNLSATLGDLANALRHVGRHDEALAVAENGLKIDEKLGNLRESAAGHGICASILMAAGRYDEADARYDQALAAARQAGDQGLEGLMLQHQGGLAIDRNRLDRATRLYRQTLQRFQETSNSGEMMRTYNSLGVAERKAGRLAEARDWHQRSRELAEQLHDQPGLGQAAQNLGIVCQLEGEAARERGDEPAARRHFEAARRSVEESLRVRQGYDNKPDEASAWSQLARIHLFLGDLDTAEQRAQAARETCESLGLKEAWKTYAILSQIAQARGDTQTGAAWARKRDNLRAELQRRAGGGNTIPAPLLQPLQQLARACARAGFGADQPQAIGPAEEEALATLDCWPDPFPDLAAHLRELATCRLPSIPDNLPPELCQLLEDLARAIRESG